MTRGRRPTPTALKVLRGNPSKRTLPPAEPVPSGAVLDVEAPRTLGKVAREEWNRLAPELAGLGLLSVVDLGLLAAWCSAWGDFCEAEKQIKRYGAVSGGKRSPWTLIRSRAVDQMLKISDRFGFSPSARTSLGRAMQTPTDQPSGDLADYLAQKPDALPPA